MWRSVLEKDVDRASAEREKELEALPRDFLRIDGNPKDWFMQMMLDNTTTTHDRMLNGNYAVRLGHIFKSFSDQLDANLRHFLSPSKTEEISKRIADRRSFTLSQAASTALMKSLVREEIDKVSDFCTGMVRDAHSEGNLVAIEILNGVGSSSF